MKEIKTWYVIFTIVIALVIFMSPLIVDKISLRYLYKEYTLQKHNSCSVTITEPTIIFRVDDIRAYSKDSQKVVNAILDNGFKVTLAVIPFDLNNDKGMLEYVQKLSNNPNVEIAVHGYKHNVSEENISEQEVIDSKVLLTRETGIKSITYIPPYNEVKKETLDMLSKHFKILSDNDILIKEGNIARIGQTVSTTNYTDLKMFPVKYIIDKCNERLIDVNICVITMHPQEFTNNTHYLDIINAVKELNLTSKTFKDLVYCTEE